MHPVLLLALATLSLLMIAVTPALVRLRIRVLEWLGWKWAADLLKNNFENWVLFFRAVLLVIGMVLLLASWAAFRR